MGVDGTLFWKFYQAHWTSYVLVRYKQKGEYRFLTHFCNADVSVSRYGYNDNWRNKDVSVSYKPWHYRSVRHSPPSFDSFTTLIVAGNRFSSSEAPGAHSIKATVSLSVGPAQADVSSGTLGSG